ncbi:DUF3124 domain-containing protein [Desulfobacca acetoxidans]|uniref:DUF3124 domain-containing protein n=1 Tax=Desulfobacca acetoxidans (strain ATCC 700848 / DSM 11109 / ASRB2) TaxID=880072 RepID=F2NJM9_DESAR|nr:DUF3124 domain-containing protein [Desulfobacca acetoxidans]AEB09684.1 hypothetical protein Desac_1845 [Desulfobacca acetoxidans DSM 11109]
MKMWSWKTWSVIWCALLILSGWLSVPLPADTRSPSKGQLVYVPVYSHIYYGDKMHSFNLGITLSLRNTETTRPIEIVSVKYYDENGKLVRDYVPPAVTLEPLAAVRFHVRESDVSAGSEACFLVRWRAPQKVSPPVIEGLMIGTLLNQGISFTATGRVLEEY